MNLLTEKPLDYRCFLLGIVLYWMFEAVWASFATFFLALECVLNPIAVVVGKSVLFLLVFYFLFRKPKMLDIKWGHIATVIGFIVLMNVLDYFLTDRFFDLRSLADNQMDRDIPNYLMKNVRQWANLITSFLTIGFLWWRFNSEATASDAETSAAESRSYYGGMLFSVTFGYLLSLINIVGGFSWQFVPHPILEEVITCLLLVLFTVGTIYLLVKKQLVVLPIVAILTIVLVHFFSTNYLYNILRDNFEVNFSTFEQMSFFYPVCMICDWALPIAAFVLYRREMKQPTL
ncbi:MAG: hypothetical protein IKU03_02585 [Bacteroidales bacterium]|nr:hypothetical protein [Bacteroidales bacterium]